MFLMTCFGHIAVACRAKAHCAKCGRDHEYGKCAEGIKIKCCNCGGEHSAAYKGCEAHKKITYAEAIKKGDFKTRNSLGPRVGLVPVIQNPAQNIVHKCCKVNENTLIVEKKTFIAFMVEVINCTAQTDSRTARIKIILKAAEKYLGEEGLTTDSINEMLRTEVVESQSSGGGGC